MSINAPNADIANDIAEKTKASIGLTGKKTVTYVNLSYFTVRASRLGRFNSLFLLIYLTEHANELFYIHTSTGDVDPLCSTTLQTTLTKTNISLCA